MGFLIMNDKLNPYLIQENQSTLQNSVVAFIDVLGFKDRVRDARKKDNSQKFFIEFKEAILETFNTLNISFQNDLYQISEGLSDIKNYYSFRIFTDCILIASPIRKSEHQAIHVDGLDQFESVIYDLHFLQSQLINRGFFIRGAVTVGEFYMDQITIYGLAGIDAYEAEANEAKYPRIILTKSAEDMLTKINQGFHNQNNYKNYLNKLLHKDDDGLFFINYLESINIEDEPCISALKKHKTMIEDNLKEHHNKPDVLDKYIWTANYHNYFCNQDNNTNYKINLAQYLMKPV